MNATIPVVRIGMTLQVAGTRRDVSATWVDTDRVWRIVEKFRDGSVFGEVISTPQGSAIQRLLERVMRANSIVYTEKVRYMERNGRRFFPFPE